MSNSAKYTALLMGFCVALGSVQPATAAEGEYRRKPTAPSWSSKKTLPIPSSSRTRCTNAI